MADSPALARRKAGLRAQLGAARAARPAGDRTRAARLVAADLAARLARTPVVAGYVPTAEEPGHGPLPAALAERMAEAWFDPEGLLLAVDEDERLLGFHWTKVHWVKGGPDLGEVYVVAIDPSTQGRGPGRQLTLAGLHHLVEKGVPEVHLYVESDNAAALAVYGRLGFEHQASDTHVQYTAADTPADTAADTAAG